MNPVPCPPVKFTPAVTFPVAAWPAASPTAGPRTTMERVEQCGGEQHIYTVCVCVCVCHRERESEREDPQRIRKQIQF